MKRKFFAVYSIDDMGSFSLSLIRDRIANREDAEAATKIYAGACVIIEYYDN